MSHDSASDDEGKKLISVTVTDITPSIGRKDILNFERNTADPSRGKLTVTADLDRELYLKGSLSKEHIHMPLDILYVTLMAMHRFGGFGAFFSCPLYMCKTCVHRFRFMSGGNSSQR